MVKNKFINPIFWKDKKVFITGHTGFKGSWLAYWLIYLGANVKGYALKPVTENSLYNELKLNNIMFSDINDIRDLDKLKNSVKEFNPDIVFHLAAQPLVRYSYNNPIETYEINVMGTANILQAVRDCGNIKSVVCITTDKCYENKEWLWSYRENEPMGGHDPYSSSKGCAELLISSFRRSFFNENNSPGISSARAGNIIGGGDWSEDRLVPDILKSYKNKTSIKIRNFHAIRPWQYILEPLRGYMLLAENLYTDRKKYSQAFNFGPLDSDVKSVGWIFNKMNKIFGDNLLLENDGSENVHEAKLLKLDCSKANQKLKWLPIYNISKTLEEIIAWYKLWLEGADIKDICNNNIEEYSKFWISNQNKSN